MRFLSEIVEEQKMPMEVNENEKQILSHEWIHETMKLLHFYYFHSIETHTSS